jgi:ABC-2 type transport system permease protein
MVALIRTELLKLRTTWTVYWMLLGMLAFTTLSVAGILASAGRVEGTAELGTDEGLRTVINASSVGWVFVLVLGILAVTGEYRYGTITQMFLVTPDRGAVVTAKLIAYALCGLAFAVVAALTTLAIALPWLASKHIEVSLFDPDVTTVLLGVLLATSLYGALGVGVGALVRNQVAAVVIALAWGFVVEGLLINLVPEVGKWLPGGAAAALTRRVTERGDLLPMWAGGLLFAAYAIVFAAIGSRFVVRRDVT